jgi:predicted Zn finger-like uncharacterized protein
MLVTTCKHCAARFRVTPDQLNVRQGQVRCGECGGLFNGFEALERFPGDDTGTRLLAARAPRPDDPPALAPAVEPDAPTAREVESPGRGAAPSPGHAPRTHWAVVPESEPEPVVAVHSPERIPEPMPELEPPVAPPTPGRGTGAARPIADYVDPPLPEPTPPERPSRAWSLAAVLVALLLGLQLAYAFRAEIATRYPPLRPTLESACELAGCTVPRINQDGALKLEDSELLEVPGKPGQIALSARIRSLAAAPMEYPHIELTLTDSTGQMAVRRVLRPADYLGRAPVAGDVLLPGTDLLVSLRLDTGRVKATGYELMLFYP